MQNEGNIPQEIIDKATRLSAIKGSRFTVEQNIEMLMKEEERIAKKNRSAKKSAKWNQRSLVASSTPSSRTMAEINRENAIKSLPSSMQK